MSTSQSFFSIVENSGENGKENFFHKMYCSSQLHNCRYSQNTVHALALKKWGYPQIH